MQAVILAGGFGTRLKEVVKDIPKPMAEIAGHPFLSYLINKLIRYGVNNIILLTGYKSEIIEKYIKESDFSAEITIIKEEVPLGTGGALFNAYSQLGSNFFMLNGDSYFDIDLGLLDRFYKSHGSVLALRYSKDTSRYGTVKFDSNYLIESFIEKKVYNGVDCFINGGVYKLNKHILEPYYNQWDMEQLSLEKDIFPKLVDAGFLYGLPVGGLFVDIGIPEDYYRANTIIPERLSQKFCPALFLDRDNVLIEDNGYVTGTELTYLNKADEYIREANAKGWYVIVVSNQSGVARGYFSKNDVNITNSNVRIAFLKKGLKIDDFYYSPYHIDGTMEQYNKFSYARKPYPGMLLEACEKYKIDMVNSIMIGDNPETDNIMLPYLKCIIV